MKIKKPDSQNNESKQTLSKSKSQSQCDRFVETAKKLEVDESGKTFEEAFSKIIPTKKKDAS